MDAENLRQHLVSPTTHLYCVLDGASVPKLPKRLFETETPNHCLFKGDLEPDMLYVAPYVVLMVHGAPFTDWVFDEGFGKHWGIFAQSRHSIREMRRHFRSLVTVYDENAKTLTFRFYDPRVLNKFVPMFDAEQLDTFFGTVESYYAESEDKLVKYQLENGSLKQKELE
ncbi:MAG: DUF4123 domain-containing protein [Pyrinomonadaceae bacterium]